MAILKISLHSFRNHLFKEIDFFEGLTVIWGENGSGKTSLLEAIHVIAYGKSFRTHNKKTLIKKNQDAFVVRGEFLSEQSNDLINTSYYKTGKQITKINGKPISSRKDIIGRNNVVVLSPEEENITKGPPENRRQFFDKMFSVTSKDYLNTLQKYNRALKQRNASLFRLKENKGTHKEVLGWTEPVVDLGVALWEFRKEFLSSYKKILKELVFLYGEEIGVDMVVKKNTLSKKEYYNLLISVEGQDKALCRTTKGPHRDEVKILWGNRPIKTFGSQGEHKLSLVFLKLAEMLFIKNKTGQYPTLLLDDLFAKLDLDRSKKLVFLLNQLETEQGNPIQTVITTTDIINVEKSGILVGKNKIKTHHLVRA